MTFYDISLILEVEVEKEEMKAWHTREICYFIANSNTSKHIDRQKIMVLPSEREKVDFLKKYETEYAERMLKRMKETTQK